MQLDKLCVACFSPTHTSMKIARAIADGTQALSILVWTGEAKPADLFQSQTQPKMICDSLAEIAALLREDGR